MFLLKPFKVLHASFGGLGMKKGCSRREQPFFLGNRLVYTKNPNRMPAATAEPITPATFGPMACINR